MAIIDRDFIMTNLSFGDAEQDKIDFCIAWATSRAETYIGRKLESSTYTWYLNGTGSCKIILPVCPVASITGIYLDGSRSFDTALDSDEYYLDEDSGIIDLYSLTTPLGVRTVKVVALAGYTADTLPADLKMGLISAISHHMVKLITRGFGVSSQTSPDGVNATYELELPTDTKKILDSYKDMRV